MKKKVIKNTKKLFSVVLSLMMILSVFSSLVVTVSASSSGTCGENLKWVYDENTLILTISGTGEMTNFASYSDVPWYSFCSNIIEIKINWGPTNISDYAFYGCGNVRAVSIPTSVTSIGSYAFYKCYSLEELTVPWKVTSIGDYAFYYCQGLGSISLPGKLTSLGEYAFHYCVALTSIDIPDGVRKIGDYTFYYCIRLKTATLPDEMDFIGEYAFYKCKALESITIPNGIGVIESNTFYGCEKLSSVLFPDTLGRIANDAFSGCKSLTTVDLPDGLHTIGVSAFAYTGITSIELPDIITVIREKTFYSCDSLVSIDIPGNVTEIERYAFEGCEKLETVNISAGVETIGFTVFNICPSLTSINVDEENSQYTSVDGVLFSKSKTDLICYPAGKTSDHYIIPDTVDTLAYNAFAYANKLRAVTLSENMSTVTSWAFYEAESLEEVTIPGNIGHIGRQSFSGCNKLSLVHFLGTEADWTTVSESAETDNTYLQNATTHYCEQKAIDGNCTDTGYENGWFCNDCQKHIFGGVPTATDPDNHKSDIFTEDGYRSCCGEYQKPVLNDDDIYEISNPGQLLSFAEIVNNGENDADAVLMAEIDLEDVEWSPICSTPFYCSSDYSSGSNYPDTGYSGTFDGNGYLIKNASVTAASGEKCTYGIFGTVSGTVKNLGVDKFTFNIDGATDICVGGIVGQVIGGTVENCFVTDSVIAPDDFVVGGIAGCNLAGNVKNCYTYGNVISGDSAPRYGHIVGDNHGDGGETDRPGTVSDCYTDGSVVIGIRGGITENTSVLSSESFSNGKLAYLLQRDSEEQVWGQDSTQAGATPILDSTGLYKVVPVANTDNYSVANKGDANGDGIVDVNDYQEIVNMALSDNHRQSGTAEYNDIVKYDMNGDGYVDVLDTASAETLLNGHTTVEVYAVGDYDSDGVAFTESDVVSMSQAMENPKTLTTAQKYACDMNGDGKVDEADLSALQKKYPMYFASEA